MSFIPRKYRAQDVRRMPLGASAVATKYGHMKESSGYLVAGAAGDNEAEFIALETVTDATAAAGGTYVDVIPVNDVDVFDATTGTTPVQATHVGNDYDFGSAVALDLTATTDKVFHVEAIIDATNKIVRGRFNQPALA